MKHLEPIQVQHSQELSPSEQAEIESTLRELVAGCFGTDLEVEADYLPVEFIQTPPTAEPELNFSLRLKAILDLGPAEMAYQESLMLLYIGLVERFPRWNIGLESDSGEP